MEPKQKTSIVPCIFVGIIVGILVYIVATVVLAAPDKSDILTTMTQFINKPAKLITNINAKAVLFGVIGVAVGALGKFVAMRSGESKAPGKEFGSSKWGEPTVINKKFAEKDIHQNRLLSQNVQISYNGKKTRINNNGVVLGGSGTGKTRFVMTPNLLNLHGSNVYTDPKGGLLDDMGNYLEDNGVVVRCINLVQMDKSNHFNPFEYIHKESDVAKLITNLIANTTPGNASKGDPFWEKAESLYLQGIFSYVWLECPRTEKDAVTGEEVTLTRSFRTVLKLLDEAEVPQKANQDSPLTVRMNNLAREKSPEHPAVRSYMKCIKGAGDTVRSIIITANARFQPFDNPELLSILDSDDMHLPWIGAGWNNDGKTKSALFCVIPDDDSTFNFVPGMLYTLLFQELYAEAKKHPGNALPLDVGFWFDEFANISMPASFDKIVATCRSRGIYVTIVLQSMAQIKALYKDEWEGIVGNCDTLTYLGGNEPGSFEYVSKRLGKATIEKESNSLSRGKSGSSSRSRDHVGRELLTDAEVGQMDNSQCILFIRGQRPIFDKKMDPATMSEYKKACALGDYYATHDGASDIVPVAKSKGKKTAEKPAKKKGLFSGWLGKKKNNYEEPRDTGINGLNEEDDPFEEDYAGMDDYDVAEQKYMQQNKDVTTYVPEHKNFAKSPLPPLYDDPTSSGPVGVIISGQLYLTYNPHDDRTAANYPPQYSTWEEAVNSYEDWTARQIYEINDGIRNGLTQEEILLYAIPDLPGEDMAIIKDGILGVKERISA